MNLTKEKIAEFVGGDMEIQNKKEYLYRGRIKSVDINDNVLLVKFAWLAKRESNKWVKEDKFASVAFVRNLNFYGVSEVRGQLILTPHFTNEIVTLFPPNGSINPAIVEGLNSHN